MDAFGNIAFAIGGIIMVIGTSLLWGLSTGIFTLGCIVTLRGFLELVISSWVNNILNAITRRVEEITAKIKEIDQK